MFLDTSDYILIVGAGDFPIYEKAFFEAAEQLGFQNVRLFTWRHYYAEKNRISQLQHRIEQKMGFGLRANTFNHDLIHIGRKDHPKLIFLYTCRLVYPSTVKKLADLGIYIASYCNDNPFSDYFPWYFWRNYLKSLPYCQTNYVFRLENVGDVERVCGRPGRLLRSYYIDSKNFPCGEGDRIGSTPDVIFLGHYEDDDRMDYLRALDERGIAVGLPRNQYERLVQAFHHVVLLDHEWESYNRYLCSCKIPITFLSSLNHDTYTTRCFEIPAAGAFLFCPYTDDLASLFQENKEIVFYRNKKDFVEKVEYYLRHDEERKKIASAGRKRLLKDGHEVKDRIAQVIEDYNVFYSRVEESR